MRLPRFVRYAHFARNERTVSDLVLAALLLGLAAYRGYRILAMDSITSPILAWLMARDEVRVCRWVSDLLVCPWCIGWWYSGIGAWVFGALNEWHPAEGIVVWLAASTVCGFLGNLDNTD